MWTGGRQLGGGGGSDGLVAGEHDPRAALGAEMAVSAPERKVRVLLTGADGQLGWELRRALLPLAVTVCAGGPRSAAADAPLDLADPAALRRRIREVRPQVVINAAAYTAVDRAEEEPDLARAVNSEAPGVLAEESRRCHAVLVHYSTDYVFDGRSTRPYRETDTPAPLGMYGQTKLDGERAVAEVGGRHLILRTSGLYAARGRNFVRAILGAAASGKPLRVVDDQFGAPTWARTVAEATAQVLAQSRVLTEDWLGEHSGLYHLSAGGLCSWYEFARRILELWFAPGQLPAVEPIPAAQYPVRAARPRYSVLDNARFTSVFGLDLAPWDEQLARVIEEIRLMQGGQ